MPRIFDNIDLKLLPEFQQTLNQATRADFCVGYFNLRWKPIAGSIDRFAGPDACRRPRRHAPRTRGRSSPPNSLAQWRRPRQPDRYPPQRMAEDFRNQLMIGALSNAGRDRLALSQRL